MPAPESFASASRKLLQRLYALQHSDSPLTLVYHGDADGIASATLVTHVADRLSLDVIPLSPEKGENIYTERFVERVRESSPGLVIVLDTGSRPGRPFGDVPTAVIDHHAFDVPPQVDVFISSRSDVQLSTSALTWSVFESTLEEELVWLAALGLIGDLGERAASNPLVEQASARFGITALRETVTLINAAGRSAYHEVHVAYAALCAADTPRDVSAARTALGARLHELRQEVSEAAARARRVAPRNLGRWAVILLNEPCRIHGIVAESWRKRLSGQIVLAANLGYVPSKVHFAVRSELQLNLREELKRLLPGAGPDLGAGHDRATGGILDGSQFQRLLEAIQREQAA